MEPDRKLASNVSNVDIEKKKKTQHIYQAVKICKGDEGCNQIQAEGEHRPLLVFLGVS